MARRTRIRALFVRWESPSCRNFTCHAHVHSNTQTRTRASEWTQVRTKTHAHVTIVHYRTVGCEGAVIRGSQYHQGRCAGCRDHRGWKPEQPPDATHTTVGPRDRRRGGHSSGRVHQRRTIGAGAGSGKTEVGGSVERRLSGSSWMEAGAAAGCYPHYRRAADAAGTYPALSYRAPGCAEAASAAAVASDHRAAAVASDHRAVVGRDHRAAHRRLGRRGRCVRW